MKRLVSVLLVLAAFCAGVMAQEAEEAEGAKDSGRNESKWAAISYYNVPIYKILDSQNAYVIIYGRQRTGLTGTTTIPKKWSVGNPQNPRKLKFRTVDGKIRPFMTVVSESGEFKRVILNLPKTPNNGVWGIAPESIVKDADKDTLEKLAR